MIEDYSIGTVVISDATGLLYIVSQEYLLKNEYHSGFSTVVCIKLFESDFHIEYQQDLFKIAFRLATQKEIDDAKIKELIK